MNNTLPKQKPLYGISEAAKLLGVSPKTLRRWEKRGRITSFRTNGNQRRYSLEELNRVKEPARHRKLKALRARGRPTPEAPEKSLLPIREAARQLGVSTKTLRRWDKQGILSPIRTAGGQRRYTQESLDHVKSRSAGHVARHVRPQRIEPPKATDGVGRKPPRRVRVWTLEEARAPFHPRYTLRKLAVIALAVVVAAQLWFALPPLTKKRLERAFSPSPINPIVDVNDIFEYKIGKAENWRIRAKYLLEADNLVAKTFNLLETGVFNTVQLVGTLFFGKGKEYFITPLADAYLRSLTLSNKATVPELETDSITSDSIKTDSLEANKATIKDLSAEEVDIQGTRAESFTIDTDDTGGDLSLIFGTTNNERLTWDADAALFTLSDDLNVTGAGTFSSTLDVSEDTSIAGDLIVTGTGTHSFAGTLDPDQVAALTLTGDVTGLGSPNITNIGQFSGTSFTDGTLTITGGNITNGGSLSFSIGTFSTSVTSPLHTGTGAVTLSSGGTSALTLDSDSGNIVMNDNLFFEKGTYDLTLAVTAPTGASRTLTIPALGADGNLAAYSGTLVAGDLLYGATTNVMGRLTIGSANQVLGVVGAGGSLEYKTISGTASEIDISHGAGSITIGIVDPLALSKGGTEASLTAVQGGVVYSGASALAISAAGTSGYALISGGTGTPTWTNTPSWSTLALSSTGNALTLSGAGANIAFTGAGLAQITTAASQDLALMPGGNVGIGTTGPGGTLHVRTASSEATAHAEYGELIVEDDGHSGISILSGTANEGTIAFGDSKSNNAGLIYYDHSTDDLNLAAADNVVLTAGSGDYVLLSGGNVGIGTTGPDSKLDVRDGAFGLSAAGVSHSITDYVPASQYGYLTYLSATIGGLDLWGVSDTSAVALSLRGVIGWVNPPDTTPAMQFMAGKATEGTSYQALANAETAFQFKNSGTNLVTILGSGNVGIGTPSPGQKLEVAGGNLGISSAASGTSSVLFGVTDVADYARIYYDDATGDIALQVDVDSTPKGLLVERGTGNVGIGTTGPGSKLEVASTGESQVKITAGGTNYASLSLNSGSTDRGAFINFDEASNSRWQLSVSNAADDLNIYNYGLSTTIFKWDYSDGHTYTDDGNVYNLASDERLKKDITTFSDGLNVITQLEPKYYKFNGLAGTVNNGVENIGLIANDVKDIAPYLTVTYDEYLNEGDATTTELYTLSHSKIIFPMINAIKEQQEQIDHVKADLLEATSAHVAGGISTLVDDEGEMARINADGTTTRIIAEEIKANQGIFERLTAKIGEFVSIIANSIKTAFLEVTDTLTAKLIRTGRLEADHVKSSRMETDELHVASEIILDGKALADTSTGEATIKAGETAILIEDPEVTPESKIFLTPLDPTGGQPLFVSKKEEGRFEVSIDHPLDHEIRFDYWIVN